MSRIYRSNQDRWGLFRRWRTYRGNIEGIWDIASPTVQVDKDWPDEDEDMWGFRVVSPWIGNAAAGELSGVELYLNTLAPEDQEIYLRRLWFQTQAHISWDTTTGGTSYRNAQRDLDGVAFTYGGFPEVYVGTWVHMFTVPSGYDPCANNTGFKREWYNGDRNATLGSVLIRHGSAAGPPALGGSQLILGPLYKSNTGSGFNQNDCMILDWDDPPLRLLSDRIIAFQCLAHAVNLTVNGIFSMRLAHKPTFGPA